MEHLASARYATCVIDPEGDYHVLAALPSVTWFAVGREGDWSDVLAALRHDPAATVVADISTASHDEKVRLVEAGLRRIRALRAARGFPHWVVLDEAHYSLHPDGVSAEAFHPDDKGFCFVTHRPSWLRPAVVESDRRLHPRPDHPARGAGLPARSRGAGRRGGGARAAGAGVPPRGARRRARDLRGAAAPHAPRPPPAQVRGPPGGPSSPLLLPASRPATRRGRRDARRVRRRHRSGRRRRARAPRRRTGTSRDGCWTCSTIAISAVTSGRSSADGRAARSAIFATH